MGLLGKFLKGAGTAAAEIAGDDIRAKIMAERDARLAQQRKVERQEEQVFRVSENQKERDFRAQESRLDRESREKVNNQRHGDNRLSPFGRDVRDMKNSGMSDDKATQVALNKYMYGEQVNPQEYIMKRANELMKDPLTGRASDVTQDEAFSMAADEWARAMSDAKRAMDKREAKTIEPPVTEEKPKINLPFSDEQINMLRQKFPNKSDEELVEMYNQFMLKRSQSSRPAPSVPMAMDHSQAPIAGA